MKILTGLLLAWRTTAMDFEKMDKESEILNSVFNGLITKKQGVEMLMENGLDEKEAARIANEARRYGKARRKKKN